MDTLSVDTWHLIVTKLSVYDISRLYRGVDHDRRQILILAIRKLEFDWNGPGDLAWPSIAGLLPNLQYLSIIISGMTPRLSITGPGALKSCPNLKVLKCSSHHLFHDFIPDIDWQFMFPKLEELYLQSYAGAKCPKVTISGAFIKSLPINLSVFEICSHSGSNIDFKLGLLKYLPASLTSLKFARGHLIPVKVGKRMNFPPHLKVLHLDTFDKIDTVELMEALPPSLKKLSIYNNNIGGIGKLRWFSKLPRGLLDLKLGSWIRAPTPSDINAALLLLPPHLTRIILPYMYVFDPDLLPKSVTCMQVPGSLQKPLPSNIVGPLLLDIEEGQAHLIPPKIKDLGLRCHVDRLPESITSLRMLPECIPFAKLPTSLTSLSLFVERPFTVSDQQMCALPPTLDSLHLVSITLEHFGGFSGLKRLNTLTLQNVAVEALTPFNKVLDTDHPLPASLETLMIYGEDMRIVKGETFVWIPVNTIHKQLKRFIVRFELPTSHWSNLPHSIEVLTLWDPGDLRLAQELPKIPPNVRVLAFEDDCFLHALYRSTLYSDPNFFPMNTPPSIFPKYLYSLTHTNHAHPILQYIAANASAISKSLSKSEQT